MIAVHLTAAAVWVGALLYVIRVGIAMRRKGLKASPVVRAYARMALALFLVVLATGTLAGVAVISLDDWTSALFDTSYGRWLLVKLGFVVVVAALAWLARRHLRRRPEASQPARSARYELGAMAGVLAISSALTVLAPPVSANSPLAFPPPDVGPTIGLGTRAGYSVVTLRVDDERWGGGRAAVKVAWPPRPGRDRLRTAVVRMRQVDHFTLHKQVTSDTATGLGPHTRLGLSGEEYLKAGPFSSGRAVTVTRYQLHRGGEVTLALSYPAERVFVLLTVDRQNRIVREVLTSGKHLVTRTLVYDEPGSDKGHNHSDG